MALSPQQFELFTAVDRDVNGKQTSVREFPSAAATGRHEAVDYAYWMNSANPGEPRHTVRY